MSQRAVRRAEPRREEKKTEKPDVTDPEAPEVFDLRPISTRRVVAKVRNRRRARFVFIDD